MRSYLVQLGHRLRQARLQAGLTQIQLARRLGRSKQLASAWEAGRSEILTSTLAEFAAAVDVDANWLLRGIESHPNIGKIARAPHGSAVPLLSAAEAIRKAKGKFLLADAENGVYTPFPAGPQAFALQVRDISLSPELTPGDIVVVDPELPPEPDAMVVAVVKQADIVLPEPTLVVRRIHFKSAAFGDAPYELIPLWVAPSRHPQERPCTCPRSSDDETTPCFAVRKLTAILHLTGCHQRSSLAARHQRT